MSEPPKSPGACRLDQAAGDERDCSAPVSGVWCVRLQGGGGRRCGASATDDDAADAHAAPGVCGVI
ncbi:hypothetical protein ABT300_42680, partial [Streptomyces sp. NPDC001027]